MEHWNQVQALLSSSRPSIILEGWRQSGQLREIMPEVDALFGVPQSAEHHPEIDTGIHTGMVLDIAARDGRSLLCLYAALCHDLGKALTDPALLPKHYDHEIRGVPAVTAMSERLGVPSEFQKIGELMCQYHTHIHRALELTPKSVVKLFYHLEVLKDWDHTDRFISLLAACQADAQGRLGFEHRPYPQRQYMLQVLEGLSRIGGHDHAKMIHAVKSIKSEFMKQSREAT